LSLSALEEYFGKIMEPTMNPITQVYPPIAPADWTYPQHPLPFQLIVPDTGANANLRVSVPGPASVVWERPTDFLIDPNVTNPLYNGLRILPLMWIVQMEWDGGDSGHIVTNSTTGPAIELGYALNTNELAPRNTFYSGYGGEGLLWRWTRPTTGDWNNYEFCAAFGACHLRDPSQGGGMVQIGFAETTRDAWSFLLTRGSAQHMNIQEWVYYLLVHTEDKDKALQRGLAGVFAIRAASWPTKTPVKKKAKKKS
jgi:hypothetical protein